MSKYCKNAALAVALAAITAPRVEVTGLLLKGNYIKQKIISWQEQKKAAAEEKQKAAAKQLEKLNQDAKHGLTLENLIKGDFPSLPGALLGTRPGDGQAGGYSLPDLDSKLTEINTAFADVADGSLRVMPYKTPPPLVWHHSGYYAAMGGVDDDEAIWEIWDDDDDDDEATKARNDLRKWERAARLAIWAQLGRAAVFLYRRESKCAIAEMKRANTLLRHLMRVYIDRPLGWRYDRDMMAWCHHGMAALSKKFAEVATGKRRARWEKRHQAFTANYEMVKNMEKEAIGWTHEELKDALIAWTPEELKDALVEGTEKEKLRRVYDAYDDKIKYVIDDEIKYEVLCKRQEKPLTDLEGVKRADVFLIPARLQPAEPWCVSSRKMLSDKLFFVRERDVLGARNFLGMRNFYKRSPEPTLCNVGGTLYKRIM